MRCAPEDLDMGHVHRFHLPQHRPHLGLAQGYNPSTHDRNEPIPRNVAILEAILLFFSFTWCIVGVIFITESDT